MNAKVLTTLEYNKIIDLSQRRPTPSPVKSFAAIWCLPLIYLPSEQPSGRPKMPGPSLPHRQHLFWQQQRLGFSIRSLEIGSSLSMSELLKLASFLDNVSRIKTYGKKEREDLPNDSLDAYFEGLTPMTQLANEINRCILSEEEMADDASPRLKSIRRSKLSTNEKIHSQLTSMVNGAYRTFLQDAVITMRDNRYCIPVKPNIRAR